MASVDRKWLPPALIAAAGAASAGVYGRVPALVDLRIDTLLPFPVTPPPEPAPRWLVLSLMPALGLVLWLAFRWAATPAGLRFARRVFRNAPDEVTDPAQFARFGKTYDAIVLGVVMLLLGLHAAVLAALLGAPGLASRLVPSALGVALLGVGNVMPRLRPNWVAGLRTQRLFDNPQLWREAHRVFGAAFVAAGIVTIIAGLVAPRYGLVVAIAMILLSCVIGFAAATRAGPKAA